MKKLEKPIEFESEVLEETEDAFIMSIPEHIQKIIPSEAKYIHIRILRILDKQQGHP